MATKPGGRWVVTCSCGWTIRLPAQKMAEQAAALHQQEAREPDRHTVRIEGEK
jgi:RNase P subunit RPR2